jgi:hypothetical protein
LKLIEEASLKYIFKQREQGIKVSTLSIFVVASNISTKFGEKDFIARCSAIKRFVRAHSLVYQMTSFVPSYSALIVTGISSSTWIRCRSIF